MVEFPHTIIGIAFIARTCKAFAKKCRQNNKSHSESHGHIFEEEDKQEFRRKAMNSHNGYRSKSCKSPPSYRSTSTKRDKHKVISSPSSSSDNNNNNNNNNHKCFSTNYFSCSPLSKNLDKNSTMSRKSSSESSSTPSPPASHLSRRSSNGIMFSNSSGMLKPPPIQRKLECSLEDLFYGVHKKIKITRDVVKSSGNVVQEEELLTIKVKPGWKKGTKITFERMGNETPGLLNPADLIFVISEKRHNVFKREGDDLEIAVGIPLVQALTGCHISIPLLGGDKMSLDVDDDVIFPGFVKVVKGQGMPVAKQQGLRGDLKVTFLVDFPKQLTQDQRLEVIGILQDSC